MLTLDNGRPANTAERLQKEQRVYDLLDSLQINYQRVDHGPVMTIAACEEVDQTLGLPVCKNLFLCNRQKTAFYLLLLPGSKKFNAKSLTGQHGLPKLSFANEDYLEEFLDITPGSVSVMGLMNDRNERVTLLIDKPLLQDPYICCHPCINTSTLRFPMKDLLETVLPAVNHTPLIVELPD